MSMVSATNLSFSFQDGIALIGLIAGIIVSVLGVLEYRASVKLQRAEWLHKLYREFYAEPQLKDIRALLDSEDGKKRISLILEKSEKSLSEEESKTSESLNDYLNFFEFMMYLKKIKAITDADISDIFQYYLGLLATSKSVMHYLQLEGYELLNEYLEKEEGKKRQ